MNGLATSPATAARSGSFNTGNTNGATQAQNSQRTMEPLLVILFAWLTSGSPVMSKKERAALSSLTRILRQYIYRILASCRVPDAWHLSEDITQIVLSRLLTGNIAEKYDERIGSRAKLVRRVARLVILEEYRKQKRCTTSSMVDDVVDPFSLRDEVMEIQSQVKEAINSLSPLLAEAILFRFGFEKPSQEFLALPGSTRHSRTWRAIQLLRIALSKVATR